MREGVSTTDSGRGKLRLVAFANPQRLQKDGASTFNTPNGVTPQAPTVDVRVVQGAIEKSNVRAVVEMTRMIELTRAYSEVAGILQQAPLSQLSQLLMSKSTESVRGHGTEFRVTPDSNNAWVPRGRAS